MRVKIISDGTIRGTKIIDTQSGDALENVSRFIVSADAAEGTINATLFLTDIELEIFNDDVRATLNRTHVESLKPFEQHRA